MYQKVCFATLLTILIISSNIFAQIGATVDPAFAPAISKGTSVDGYNSTVQPDGKIIVTGTFMVANGNIAPKVVRINADGSFDNGFNCSACDFYTVDKPLVQPDGKIIVPGSTLINNVSKSKVIRLNSDGSLDNTYSFQPLPFFGSSSASVRDIQSDGKIFVIETQSATSYYTTFLYRLNADGSRDSGFHLLSADVRNGEYINIKLLPDGRLFIFGNNSYGYLVKLNSDGSKDTSFESPVLTSMQTTPPRSPGIFDIALQTDGKIVFVGYFNSANGIMLTGAGRLNLNQSVDAGFTPTFVFPAQYGIGKVYAVSNNKLLFVTSLTNINVYMERHNYDGSIDNTYNFPSILNNYKTISIDASERVYLSGLIYIDSNNPNQNIFQRYNSNGSLDTTFNPTFESAGTVSAIGLQPDGKVLVGGTFKRVNGFSRANVSRLNADGTLDTGFDTENKFSSEPDVFAVQPDGKILVGGYYSYEGSFIGLVRLNSNGTKDISFGFPVVGFSVSAIVVQPDGKILIGGSFTSVNGVTRSGLARLNSDGTLDTAFNPQFGGGANIRSILLFSNGQFMVGGTFTGVNGFNRANLAKLNSDGSLDTSFNSTTTPVKKIIVQTDEKLLVLGISGVIKRLNFNGSEDSTVQSTPSVGILDFELLYDGSIVIVGQFQMINNQAKNRIARLSANGTVEAVTFFKGANGIVRKVVRQPNGKIVIGGDFTSIEDIIRTGLSRISIETFARRTMFDFDGDGRADIGVYRPSNNVWYQLLGSNYQFSSFGFGSAGDILAPADYDGDGKTDFGIFRPSTGAWWYAASSQGNTFRGVQWGKSGDIPLPYDFDGDGKTDYIIYRPSESKWYILNAVAGSGSISFGIAGDKPLIGDFDGDGKADIAVYRPSNGVWWYNSSRFAGHRAVQFGISTDIPVPADYDGDGKTDFAVYRPSDGVWHILQSSNGNYVAYQFGISEDKPIAADYDGDGKADLAVYRPSNGGWYLMRSTAGFVGIQFGITTDKPIPNAFVQ